VSRACPVGTGVTDHALPRTVCAVFAARRSVVQVVAVFALLVRVPVCHTRVAVISSPTACTRPRAMASPIDPAAGVAVPASDRAATDAKMGGITSIAVLTRPPRVAAGAVASPVETMACVDPVRFAAGDVATATGAEMRCVTIVAVVASPRGRAGRTMPSPIDPAAVGTVLAADGLVAIRTKVLAITVGAIGRTPVRLTDDVEAKDIG
jgi:hypothetical protein